MQNRQNFSEKRQRMVEEQLEARDISDENVLSAMAKVPRHKFFPQSN